MAFSLNTQNGTNMRIMEKSEGHQNSLSWNFLKAVFKALNRVIVKRHKNIHFRNEKIKKAFSEKSG
jgi:hypothetical protein